MSPDEDRRRTNGQLRKMVDDFLDHLRYICRQDWNEFRQEELVLAKSRWDWLADELGRILLEDKPPENCGCEICAMIRLTEDRRAGYPAS